MSRRQRRSDGEEELVEGEQIERLMRRLQQASHRDQFKALVFDGTGDADYFIRQFMEVAEANRWQGLATRLHLQETRR